jgi:hypothetical protein
VSLNCYNGPPRRLGTRGLTGAAAAAQLGHAGPVPLIPSELAPRWRDLPALAWLATDRLAGPAGRVRGLGLIAPVG